MTSFKASFDIEPGLTYLNTPGNGLLPQRIKAWRRNFDEEFYRSGSGLRDQQGEFLDSVRQEVATFFGSKSSHTFLAPSFSYAYSRLIEMLPADFRYVLLEDEYPSLAYPLASHRLNHRSIAVSAQVEEEIQRVIAQEKPDVLVLSLTQYISGLTIGIDFLKDLKSRYPDLWIIADGTQFLGTTTFHFQESGIDALIASGYKWLLAGFGNGFISLSPALKDYLTRSLSDIPAPQAPMWLGKTALRTVFEPGHGDNLALGTLREALRFLQDLGIERIENHIHEITEQAYGMLADRDLLLPYISSRPLRSPLINVQVDPGLYPALLEAGLMCYPRGTGIRIGIHLYNDITDIQRLVDLIENKNEI